MLRLQMGRLLMLALAVHYCTAGPTTDLVVRDLVVLGGSRRSWSDDFTAFSKLAPTDFQAVIQSVSTEASAIATTTISTIRAAVKFQGSIVAAVDTGAGYASEGQDLVTKAQGRLEAAQSVLEAKEGALLAAKIRWTDQRWMEQRWMEQRVL